MIYDVIEYKGFGVVESPTIENDRKPFPSIEEAIDYLQSNRKDKGLSWANWETPYSYIIQSSMEGKVMVTYTSKDIDNFIKLKNESSENKSLDYNKIFEMNNIISDIDTIADFLINAPKTREISLATTKLQEANFWLKHYVDNL